jgi:hypothetical protein
MSVLPLSVPRGCNYRRWGAFRANALDDGRNHVVDGSGICCFGSRLGNYCC